MKQLQAAGPKETMEQARNFDLKTLRNDDSSGGKHCPPGVDQLVFPVLLHGGCVLSKAKRVIAVAAAFQ
jgi:hypothetical protein